MKILHLCLGSFYPDNFSYQENMLPKYHKILGYDVEVIASLQTFDVNGNITYMKKACTYFNEYGIKVTRLSYKKPVKIYHKMKSYIGTFSAISKVNPNIIFIHGVQFVDVKEIVRYAKTYPKIKIYVDNHCDFSNSATNWLSKNILHKIIWKHYAQMIEQYVTKFYGVLPARVDFLVNLYKLPKNKVELLVMGTDDQKVIEVKKSNSRNEIREKYNITNEDFLIMTGGKIDTYKTQTLLLMQAVNKLSDKNIKLIVFGSVTIDLKEKVNSLCNGNKVQYIGWIKSEDSYKYFAAADLVVFPGRHSVFWEQVTGQGIPMICKYWKGTTHIDLGGNVKFLYKDSTEEIMCTIKEIYNNKDVYKHMKQVATNLGMKIFSYKDIAQRCLNRQINK